ncbi:MAG: hypothetical protein ACRC80_39775 [Waterburya sp.]
MTTKIVKSIRFIGLVIFSATTLHLAEGIISNSIVQAENSPQKQPHKAGNNHQQHHNHQQHQHGNTQNSTKK